MAYEAAKRSLPRYAHRLAPKKYTQHQLLAILVLKTHLRQDYRGICAVLRDSPGLCRAIELRDLPHFTTLQKASRRLLSSASVRQVLDQTVALARGDRRRTRVTHAAADSTGFDNHHVSRYFIWRTHRTRRGKQPAKRVAYRRFGKLMVLVCCTTHLVLNAVASAGPTPDIGELEPLMAHKPPGVVIERLVADAGFDSAHNHRLLREVHGICSVIPPEHGRPPKDGKLPADPYRRRMKTHFNKKAYRRRSQVETVMSMVKRNLGATLRGRTHHARRRDMLLMTITHNAAIVHPLEGFLQSPVDPFSFLLQHDPLYGIRHIRTRPKGPRSGRLHRCEESIAPLDILSAARCALRQLRRVQCPVRWREVMLLPPGCSCDEPHGTLPGSPSGAAGLSRGVDAL